MPAMLAQRDDENYFPPTEGNSDTLGWQTGVGPELGKLSLFGTHPRPSAATDRRPLRRRGFSRERQHRDDLGVKPCSYVRDTSAERAFAPFVL
jgi:hypothetical protein